MNSQKLTPGKYYIGDPCYILSETLHDVWEREHDFDDGIYEFKCLDAENTGYFAVHSTAYGDGFYPSSSEFMYPVDSGTIALVSADLVNAPTMGNGDLYSVHEFVEEVSFNWYDGTCEIKSGDFRLLIYTNDSDSDSDSRITREM